jgi:hypothetical protein
MRKINNVVYSLSNACLWTCLDYLMSDRESYRENDRASCFRRVGSAAAQMLV